MGAVVARPDTGEVVDPTTLDVDGLLRLRDIVSAEAVRVRGDLWVVDQAIVARCRGLTTTVLRGERLQARVEHGRRPRVVVETRAPDTSQDEAVQRAAALLGFEEVRDG